MDNIAYGIKIVDMVTAPKSTNAIEDIRLMQEIRPDLTVPQCDEVIDFLMDNHEGDEDIKPLFKSAAEYVFPEVENGYL